MIPVILALVCCCGTLMACFGCCASVWLSIKLYSNKQTNILFFSVLKMSNHKCLTTKIYLVVILLLCGKYICFMIMYIYEFTIFLMVQWEIYNVNIFFWAFQNLHHRHKKVTHTGVLWKLATMKFCPTGLIFIENFRKLGCAGTNFIAKFGPGS